MFERFRHIMGVHLRDQGAADTLAGELRDAISGEVARVVGEARPATVDFTEALAAAVEEATATLRAKLDELESRLAAPSPATKPAGKAAKATAAQNPS